MVVSCPRCGQAVGAGQINVATDLAVCRACDNAFKVSTVVAETEEAPLGDPPPGARFEDRPDGFQVGATTRSPVAFVLVPFMIVWSGFSLGGIYGTQIIHGKFNPFESLFGIPFLVGSVVFWSFALMAIWGKCVVTVRNDDAELFLGVGRLGWRRKFAWSSIHSVVETNANVRYPGGQHGALALEGKTRIKFATGLSEARRYFVLHALRRKLKRPAPMVQSPYRAQ